MKKLLSCQKKPAANFIPKKSGYQPKNIFSTPDGKSFLGQMSPWTKVSLDNRPLDTCPLGKRSPWTTVPWTNMPTPPAVHSNLLIFNPIIFMTSLFHVQPESSWISWYLDDNRVILVIILISLWSSWYLYDNLYDGPDHPKIILIFMRTKMWNCENLID